MIGYILGMDVLIAGITYMIYGILTVRSNYLKLKKDECTEYHKKKKTNDRAINCCCIIILINGIVLILGIFLAV